MCCFQRETLPCASLLCRRFCCRETHFTHPRISSATCAGDGSMVFGWRRESRVTWLGVPSHGQIVRSRPARRLRRNCDGGLGVAWQRSTMVSTAKHFSATPGRFQTRSGTNWILIVIKGRCVCSTSAITTTIAILKLCCVLCLCFATV